MASTINKHTITSVKIKSACKETCVMFKLFPMRIRSTCSESGAVSSRMTAGWVTAEPDSPGARQSCRETPGTPLTVDLSLFLSLSNKQTHTHTLTRTHTRTHRALRHAATPMTAKHTAVPSPLTICPAFSFYFLVLLSASNKLALTRAHSLASPWLLFTSHPPLPSRLLFLSLSRYRSLTHTPSFSLPTLCTKNCFFVCFKHLC